MHNFKAHLRQFLLIFPIFLAVSATSFAQDRTWERYSPKSGGWSILAPGIMRPDDDALKANGGQGSYAYNDFNGFFAVVYKDYSPMGFMFGKKGHYAKQRDLVLKANKGKLIKDEAFSKGAITGREVQILMPDNRVIERESNIKKMNRVQRFRMFFDGYRFYMILAVLPEAEINSAAVTDYLNSFVIK
jgi:hypothetical protein